MFSFFLFFLICSCSACCFLALGRYLTSAIIGSPHSWVDAHTSVTCKNFCFLFKHFRFVDIMSKEVSGLKMLLLLLLLLLSCWIIGGKPNKNCIVFYMLDFRTSLSFFVTIYMRFQSCSWRKAKTDLTSECNK